MKHQLNTRFFVQAALIAAVYFVLTVVLAPISYGILQVRISEALTVLPMFTPASIPGLFIGCLLANLLGGAGILDIIFGSLATLLAAVFTYLLRKNRYVAMIPPVLANALIVGSVLFYQSTEAHSLAAWAITCASVGLGQLLACYVVGVPLSYLLDRYKQKIFPQPMPRV